MSGTKAPEACNSHLDTDTIEDLEQGPTTDISADSILLVASVEAEPTSTEPAAMETAIMTPRTKAVEAHDEQPSQLWRWEPALLSIIWEEDTNATARQKRRILLLLLLVLLLLVAVGIAVGVRVRLHPCETQLAAMHQV